MEVEILGCGDGASCWRNFIRRLPQECRDVYFAPEYHQLHEMAGEASGECQVVRQGDCFLLIPGIRTAIEDGVFDLQTCSGYGGPLASSDADRNFLEEAWLSWRTTNAERGLVAGFFRLHPLLSNERWLPPDAKIFKDRETVYVDLQEGIQQAWRRADSRHRNRVNKSNRAGLRIEWNTAEAWDDFPRLYREAMDRLGASEHFYFSDCYFQLLRSLKNAQIASAHTDEGIVAAAVYLLGDKWGHYHLGARKEDAPNYAMNALFQAGLENAAKLNLAGVHYGGGRTPEPDDTLLQFKRRLGGMSLDFKVALVVADDMRYRSLSRAWEARAGIPPKWLLSYRQPLN